VLAYLVLFTGVALVNAWRAASRRLARRCDATGHARVRHAARLAARAGRLVEGKQLGMALSTAALGLYYALLATWVWRRAARDAAPDRRGVRRARARVRHDRDPARGRRRAHHDARLGARGRGHLLGGHAPAALARARVGHRPPGDRGLRVRLRVAGVARSRRAAEFTALANPRFLSGVALAFAGCSSRARRGRCATGSPSWNRRPRQALAVWGSRGGRALCAARSTSSSTPRTRRRVALRRERDVPRARARGRGARLDPGPAARARGDPDRIRRAADRARPRAAPVRGLGRARVAGARRVHLRGAAPVERVRAVVDRLGSCARALARRARARVRPVGCARRRARRARRLAAARVRVGPAAALLGAHALLDAGRTVRAPRAQLLRAGAPRSRRSRRSTSSRSTSPRGDAAPLPYLPVVDPPASRSRCSSRRSSTRGCICGARERPCSGAMERGRRARVRGARVPVAERRARAQRRAMGRRAVRRRRALGLDAAPVRALDQLDARGARRDGDVHAGAAGARAGSRRRRCSVSRS
jgi:hypothetical protein